MKVEGEGAGPRYAQTSNAYRPMLSARVERLLRALMPGRRRAPAPIPDDMVQYRADEAEAVAAMRAGLSCRELARATVDGALGRVLERLGAALDGRAVGDERESHDDPEPRHRVIDQWTSALASSANRSI